MPDRITLGTPRQPSDADRDALRADLLTRARAVRADGWAPHREHWTEAQAAAVAYLLNDTDTLADLEETEGTVLTRAAADLFGFHAARKDIAKGLPATQSWFATLRTAL